jgi:hypothetical protein
MPPETYKIKDGTFTVGVGETAFAQQLRGASVVPSENVEEEEDIEVLSGDVVEGEDNVTHDYVLNAKILQDLSAGGFVDWSWTNKGTWQAFTLQPRGTVARAVTGEVRVVPITIGGDVKARAESDLSWQARNVTFGDVAP